MANRCQDGPLEWLNTRPATPRRGHVLLDRDGVINVDRAESVTGIDQFQFETDALAALAALNALGYGAVVVTNQAVVGRGKLSRDMLQNIHDHLTRSVDAAGGRIDAIYCCVHAPADGCLCRKPAPGLIEAAAARFQFQRDATWLVGDDARDIHAAQAAGLKPALVMTGKGEALKDQGLATEFSSLRSFVESLEQAQ